MAPMPSTALESDTRAYGIQAISVEAGKARKYDYCEEEKFDTGMKNNAMEFDGIDDGDHKLDFKEFCALVKEREDGKHTKEELRRRFKALDADGSGQVDMSEYIRFTLRVRQTKISRVFDG